LSNAPFDPKCYLLTAAKRATFASNDLATQWRATSALPIDFRRGLFNSAVRLSISLSLRLLQYLVSFEHNDCIVFGGRCSVRAVRLHFRIAKATTQRRRHCCARSSSPAREILSDVFWSTIIIADFSLDATQHNYNSNDNKHDDDERVDDGDDDAVRRGAMGVPYRTQRFTLGLPQLQVARLRLGPVACSFVSLIDRSIDGVRTDCDARCADERFAHVSGARQRRCRRRTSRGTKLANNPPRLSFLSKRTYFNMRRWR
jgi:hypothetical protein